ncbi:MAG: prepilin-type N-terminal cleavage/methylation domain-containing protein [Candidatus Gastranaerophilaceae bacterium]
MKKRFGFTLAEVLITLGIIGVVAAMTIPTLMNQTGQAEFKTGFKKIISTLNQAITMNVALDSTDFSGLSVAGSADGSIYNMFNTRMNVVRVLTAADATGVDVGATGPVIGNASNYALFFNDGMVISFPSTITGCLTTSTGCDALVDVNGAKKPNKLTNCQSSLLTDGAGTCTSTNAIIGDRFSIRFGGQQVVPNGQGARYVMYN